MTWRLLGPVSLLLWSCAGPKAVISPDWILSQPLAYPTTHYLVGVGSAPTSGGVPAALEAASASARTQIGQTLEVRVEHVGEFLSEISSEKPGRNPEWAIETERSSLGSFTRTSTSQIVRGIELKEKYLDEERRVVYVLAVLDKSDAATRLTAETEELSERVQVLSNQARAYEQTGEFFPAIRTLRMALESSLKADVLRKQHLVIAPHSSISSQKPSTAELTGSLADLLRSISLHVEVDAPPLLVDAVHEAIAATELNSNAGASPESTGLTLWGQMTEKWDGYPALDGSGDTLSVCRAYLSLKLVENRTNRIAGQINLVANSNAKEPVRARERAVARLRKRVIEKVPIEVFKLLSDAED